MKIKRKETKNPDKIISRNEKRIQRRNMRLLKEKKDLKQGKRINTYNQRAIKAQYLRK